jgi:hypothetical protein
MANISNSAWKYEEGSQDLVNVKVTPGDAKTEQKKKDIMKIEKNGNISTDIEQFRLERSSFCSTKIINMDACSLLANKKTPDSTKTTSYDCTFGANPPPSPRSSRDLYDYYILLLSHYKFMVYNTAFKNTWPFKQK